MKKELAIKGHPTRGKEVIELLKMMGGINESNHSGKGENSIYYLRYYVDNVAADILYQTYPNTNDADFKIFTLEEFLEKYPYKVGDKVEVCGTNKVFTIGNMIWEDTLCTVHYANMEDFEYYTAKELKVYKETNMNENKFGTAKEPLELKSNAMKLVDDKCERTREDVIFDSIIWHLRNSVNNGKQNLSGGECEDYFREVVKKNNENKMKNVLAKLLEHIKTTPKEDLEKEFEEIKEWLNVGPIVEEFMDFCDKVYKKPEYPKTYDECCSIMGGIIPTTYLQYNIRPSYKFEENLRDLLESLRKLIICRDAYWKIAGEEMGLGKPWEPKFGKTVLFGISFYLYQDSFVLHKGEYSSSDNCLLVFPTEEMRDAFYENFKDLIEQCKELL